MNHPDSLSDTLLSLDREERPRSVLSQTGTTRESQYVRESEIPASADPDALFGNRAAYVVIKHEKPQHRLMLWLRLQGHNVKETAALTGYTPQTVSNVCNQPWFIKAFCELSKELGKDAVQTMLEGEVIPSIQKLVKLRDTAESEAVAKAAADSILDRFLGKAVAKSEVKTTGTMDINVYDAAKLQEEFRRNQEILNGRGLGAN